MGDEIMFMESSKLEKLIELGIYSKEMVEKVRGIKVPSLPSSSSSSAVASSNATSEESRDKDDEKKSFGREMDQRSRFSERTKKDDTLFGPFQRRVLPQQRNRTPSPIRRLRDLDKDSATLEEERARRRAEDLEKRKKREENFARNSRDKKSENISDWSDWGEPRNSVKKDLPFNDSDNRYSDQINYNKSKDIPPLDRSDQQFNHSPNYNKPKDVPLFNRSDTADEDFRSSDTKKSRFDELREERITNYSRNSFGFNSNQSNFFDDNRNKRASQTTETISDIDSFIKQCSTNPLTQNLDDIDNFIKQSEMKLKGKLNAQRRPPVERSKQNQNNRLNHSNEMAVRRDMPSSRYESNDFNRNNASLDRNRDNYRENSNMRPHIESNADPKHIDILKDTVKELSKSNLYCEFCKCNLSSLAEVNTHIGTVLHQQNMAKHELSLTKSFDGSTQFDNNHVLNETPANKLTGIAFLTDIIGKRQQITLNLLTNMNSYEIKSEEEATVAKELAQLLTNELLNYKMNLMPNDVREALKQQGIGLQNQ